MVLTNVFRSRIGIVGVSGVSVLGLSAMIAIAAPPAPRALKAQPVGVLQYNRDIRPILAENCFSCHGPDSAARKADLRLDKPATEAAIKSGSAAIIPGKPEASEMIKRILGQGSLMPPAYTHKNLKPAQIATLKAWVAQGAKYEPHWAYIPPKKSALPTVKLSSWPRNGIDYFILAKLESLGLTPAAEADRRTLARRLSLDLTGLPPDPADVDHFVADKSPKAYESLVDKFLASPRFGEHRGRYWLDAARYADTNGIHFDNYREIFSYRDWVIRAFNANMPFDEFTIEQLAGDLLPNPQTSQLIATGFTRCNITTNEGGAIDEEYKVLYARDRTETTATVFMGSSLGCCVCHDHKYDPFTMKDFYSFSAFFNNTTQAAMDGNVKDTAPVIPVSLPEDTARLAALKVEIPAARKLVDDRKAASRADFDNWIKAAKWDTASASIPTNGLKVYLPLNEGDGSVLTASVNGAEQKLTTAVAPAWDNGQVSAKAFQRKSGSVVELPTAGDFEATQSFSYAAWIKLPANGAGGSIIARMDDQHDFRGWDLWLENDKIASHIINKWPDTALKVVSRNPMSRNQWHHVCIVYPGTSRAGDVKVYVDGAMTPFDIASDSLKGSIKTAVPFKLGQRHTTAGVDGVSIQDVRVYDRALGAAEAAGIMGGTRVAYLVGRGSALAGNEREEVYTWWLGSQDAQYRTYQTKLAALETENTQIMQRGTVAHIAQEKPTPAMAFILNRGEYDKRRDQVAPATPASLITPPADYPKNRLGLAKWIVMPGNPLTARVTVNRFWQEVFGVGIVRTAGDFGVNGEIPVNQALLDWLAVDFRENDWNVKRFFKQLVMSATYRQAAIITPEKKRLDAENRYCSRGPRFRMDAEVIRDYALAAGGLLSSKIGGPSVRPYQPDGVWEAVAMIGSNTRDYRRDSGESLYRRSMYTFWKRAAPPASLDVFNAPSRETCTVRRDRTNTPLQALVTLNDIQYVEAARNLAQRALLQGGSTDTARENFIAKRLIARPFTPAEQAIVQKSLASLTAHYKGDLKDAQMLITTGESKPDPTIPAEKLAAWTMLSNQLMNLDEVLNK